MSCLKSRWCCGGNLRLSCLIIGYLNLLACVVDLVCHLLVTAIITHGFQCDVDTDGLRAVDWPWLEPLLLIVNVGIHGFYPFPLVIPNHDYGMDRFPLADEPACYPGMLHVYISDVLNFLINLIWLKFVISYVCAVHRKDPSPMNMFFGLSLVKLVLQVMYYGYQPDFRYNFSAETYWFIKLIDIGVTAVFLIIINKYTRTLWRELRAETEQPPSYIECLINGSARRPPKDEEKNTGTLPTDGEKKPSSPTNTPTDKP